MTWLLLQVHLLLSMRSSMVKALQIVSVAAVGVGKALNVSRVLMRLVGG